MSLAPANDYRADHPNAPGYDAARLPANIEAEQALLGAVLYENDAFHLCEGVEAEDFAEPFHQRLWAAIAGDIGKGLLADTIKLANEFQDDPALIELGGLGYLADLVNRAPPGANAPDYARTVADLSLRRRIITTASEAAQRARDDTDAAEALEFAETSILGLRSLATTAGWQAPEDMISGALERAKASRGVIEYPLGIPAVDRLLGGLHRQEVTVLAARPGMGKTVAAQAYAKAIARQGLATLFFSLEMGPDPMALRLACDVARDRASGWGDDLITLERINRADLNDRDWKILDDARAEVAKWPIRFDTRPGHTMARMESLSRRAFRDFERRGIKPGLIIIDHMGKVRPGSDRRGNKHAEVADISGAAAEMAKRLDVPVLLLCQLNRQVEGRPDKQPTLSDLRQAGEIEEDARQVIFLSRPEYYLREPGADESIADRMEREDKLAKVRNKLFWIVAKNSNGPTGTALTRCDISASAIREWTDR